MVKSPTMICTVANDDTVPTMTFRFLPDTRHVGLQHKFPRIWHSKGHELSVSEVIVKIVVPSLFVTDKAILAGSCHTVCSCFPAIRRSCTANVSVALFCEDPSGAGGVWM
uniref:Uncharacterized protein n=1 Tax=Anguilla anguilla TaxID=7936 RepID=A0A0E9WH60_ANGAN